MAGSAIPRVTPKRGVILDLVAARGWTQGRLAERLKIDPALFAKQLRGSRPMDLVTAVLVAAQLGVEWTDIVEDECPTCGVNVGPKRRSHTHEQVAA